MRGKEIPPKKTDEGKTVLYHGTNIVFSSFRTPTGTEKMDVMEGGVVYLTSDIKMAKRYAGPNGYVCVVEIEDPTPYKEQRKKQGLPPKTRRFVRNVYVALPIQAKIVEFKSVKEMDEK